MKTIKFDNCKITAKVDDTGSNYNMAVHLYIDGSKTPHWGSYFKATAHDRELLEWAFKILDREKFEDLITPPHTR